MRPEWSGASVVTVNGAPVLRAYGLTQHPNLLGGFLMVATLAALGLAASRRGASSAAAGVMAAVSFTGLLLTFSRAAWLGFALGGVVGAVALLVLTRGERANRRALSAVAVAFALIGILFALTQWPLLRPRLGLSVEGVEIRSADERSGLHASAMVLISEHALSGVGYGGFSWALWQRQPEAIRAYPIYQPVHRVPLLAAAELGAPGALIWFVLAAGPWLVTWRRRTRWPGGGVPPGEASAILAILAALTVVSWFDFYPWFSQQGRLLAWMSWGLWAQTAPPSALRGRTPR
jgi:O-antigen ligase